MNRFLVAALKALRFVIERQRMRSLDPNLRGAVAGLSRDFFDAALRGEDAEAAWKKVLAPEQDELQRLCSKQVDDIISGN